MNPVNLAFSKQSVTYDQGDRANPVLQDLRRQVYEHVSYYIKPNAHILELNAGTGLDAVYFISKGHTVHAIDLSDGMIEQLKQKVTQHHLYSKLTVQQLSYTAIEELEGQKFDYVFSNFGGLNCVADLSVVTRQLGPLLNPGALVTFVIMPSLCPWELTSVLKGNFETAFRRLKSGGVLAHLEGHYFKTYYHSLAKVRSAMGSDFRFVHSEGLAALSPMPHRLDFPARFPRTYRALRIIDGQLRNHFPFNRCADHIITTFAYKK